MSILCYHAVDESWQSPLAVPPEAFVRHCEWLATHKRVVPLKEAASRVTVSGRLPRGQAAITFDDGFESLFT
ncbi:MAG: polysaccharide deacetylase, partial [Actinomycetota bacterium]|nr:polysaccharide deacetylase [Actinomycetota bacterium]